MVGESGSGKSTLALALLGYTRPGVKFAGGTIEIGGESVVGRDARTLRGLRGKIVSYVPQDPGAALNPSMRIGDAILDVLRAHRPGASGDEHSMPRWPGSSCTATAGLTVGIRTSCREGSSSA